MSEDMETRTDSISQRQEELARKIQAGDNTTVSEVLKFLVFLVGDEYYACGLGDVLEVTKKPNFVSIPFTSQNVLGLTNLRGNPLPLIDLRMSFSQDSSDRPRYMIVADMEEYQMGFGVDEIQEVISLSLEDITHDQNLKTSCDVKYLLGVYYNGEYFIRFVNLKKWVEDQEFRMKKNR